MVSGTICRDTFTPWMSENDSGDADDCALPHGRATAPMAVTTDNAKERETLYVPRPFCYPFTNMSTNLDQLTADAMKLPLRDRVQLAQRLVSTLDDEVESDAEKLWFAEAERRLEELRSGKVEGIDSDEAFRTAGEALKR